MLRPGHRITILAQFSVVVPDDAYPNGWNETEAVEIETCNFQDDPTGWISNCEDEDFELLAISVGEV